MWDLDQFDGIPLARNTGFAGTKEECLIERDRLNAAYMQGWRDRDEDDDE